MLTPVCGSGASDAGLVVIGVVFTATSVGRDGAVEIKGVVVVLEAAGVGCGVGRTIGAKGLVFVLGVVLTATCGWVARLALLVAVDVLGFRLATEFEGFV